MKILGRRVLLEPIDPSPASGTIYIPETLRGKSVEGIVRGLGSGEYDFKIGDRVSVSAFGGQAYQGLRLVSVKDVYAVLEPATR